MMNKPFRLVLSLIITGLIFIKSEASPQSGIPMTRKTFDFVVGVDGDFKAAITAASKTATSGKRFYIFFPNGEYNIGPLTGDANQKTTISTSNISLIGQNIDSTVIYNKATNESISTTATLCFNKASNLYLQDLTVLNKGNYGDPAAVTGTGRYVAVQDQGDKNIYKHVRLLSYQDTYYTQSTRTYWEDGEIHGFVDFICGYGDIFFNRCLLFLEQRSSVVIAAPSTQTSWGYVFMDCTIDGLSGDGYRLGRPWSNKPKCVYINTIMKKIPSSAGWGDPMNVVPSVFAEYNSKTASGSPVDMSGRRTSYTINGTTVKLNPVLSPDQAAEYTLSNVLKGSDNWQPDMLAKQLNAPIVRREGTTLNWTDDENALCWVLFRNGKYFKCVSSNSCDISADAKARYTVRAANEMGGLGPASDSEVRVTISCPGATEAGANSGIFRIISNPSSRVSHISLNLEKPTIVGVALFDMQGRVLLDIPSKEVHSGNSTIDISAVCRTPGVYKCVMRIGRKQTTCNVLINR